MLGGLRCYSEELERRVRAAVRRERSALSRLMPDQTKVLAAMNAVVERESRLLMAEIMAVRRSSSRSRSSLPASLPLGTLM